MSRSRQRRELQQPKEETRARLLQAADSLIQEEGFPDLRVEEVARRAGTSVGTFYLYFEGKDDLFVQLVLEHTERLRSHLAEAAVGPGTVVERLGRRFDAYLDFVSENRRGFLYFRGAGTIDTTAGSLSTWASNVHASDLRPLLEEGIAAGELRPVDAELLSQSIVGLLQHLAGYWLENIERIQRDEVRRFADDLLARGVAVQHRRR